MDRLLWAMCRTQTTPQSAAVNTLRRKPVSSHAGTAGAPRDGGANANPNASVGQPALIEALRLYDMRADFAAPASLLESSMTLPLKERLIAHLVPATLYYSRRIVDEARWGEHELSVLRAILAPGGTAVDVGANQGFFAFAFSQIADRVEAFEPNPDCAAFSRRMLGRRARVHGVALSNRAGRREFVVPVSEEGRVLHLGGALVGDSTTDARTMRFAVDVRTLDSYGFTDVRVIKVDVEGSEMDVLEGARTTILRDRPVLIVELLTGAHSDPVALTETICAVFGYSASLVRQDGGRQEALPVLRDLGSNTTWGSAIRNRNVLFLPQS
jgi:FkbM family methyltransferase